MNKFIMNKKYHIRFFLLFVLPLLVYYPILCNDFVYHWDDQWMVINHYTQGGINIQNIFAILIEFYNGQYGPLNEYLFLFLYTLFGYNPLPFHLASLVLHLGCVCLVYVIIKKIFKQTRRINIEKVHYIALFTALIFALHPINVEAVAWVSAVKVLNYAFFYLMATYMYMLYLEKKRFFYYLCTIFLFVVSFGGKEQAVTFPVWLLMLYWLLGYSLSDKRIWLQILPFFILSIVFGMVTMLSQAAAGGGVLVDSNSYLLWQRCILGCYSIFEYIAKFLFPYKLLYIYPFPMIIGEPVPFWMLLYPTLMVIICITLWHYLIRWPIAIGLLFFFLHIAITLHIIPLSRFSVIADRYMYIASIGLAFILVYYIFYFLCEKIYIILFIISIYVIFLGVFSNIRCREWKDTESIKKELRDLLKQRDDYDSVKF